MLVVVRLDSSLYEDAVEIVPGKYRDLDQLIEVALRNQIALESGAESRIDPGVSSAASANAEPRAVGAPVTPPTRDTDWRSMVRRAPHDLLPSARSERRVGAVLWGQLNRLLPNAAGVRTLANLIVASQTSSIELPTWYETASDVAVAWGAELQKLDGEAGRKHGQLWATAFPKDDRTSRRRYISQFLGLPGAVPQLGGAEALGFVAFDESAEVPRVGLTPAGTQWASLENPIFDGRAPSATFGVMEARFFLEHLQAHLPDEFAFMRLMADLIDAGHDRESMDREIAKVHTEWEGYVDTMRAGAIGRLHDLGLLHRIRKGQRVEYALTDLAHDLDIGTSEIGGN